MPLNPHSYFLNQLQIGSSGRRLYFDATLTSKTKQLARLLAKLNVLRRFHRLHNDTYRIFPTFTRYRKYNRPTKTYARVNGRIRLSLRALRIIDINTPHTYYVLETSSGVMTHKEALRLKLGGLLLMIIY